MSAYYYPQALGRSGAVDELLRTFTACQPLNSERSILDLPIVLYTGQQTILRITLAPQFPQERPALIVLAPIQSPAVDPSGRVRCRGLDDWNASIPGRASLLAVVREALGVLTRPPQGLQQGSSQAPASSHFPVIGGVDLPFLAGPMPGGPMSGVGTSRTQAPKQVDLDSLSTSDLERLLSNEEAMSKFKTDWIRGTQASQALEEIRRQNIALAGGNVAMQGDIDEARNHVAIVRSSEYATVKSHFDELYRRQEAVQSKFSTAIIAQKLQEKVDQVDEISSSSEDAFLSAKMPTDLFLEQYLGQRTEYHRLDSLRQALKLGRA